LGAVNNEDNNMKNHHAGLDPEVVRRLNDEIRYLRSRLDQIGYDGDSAYERALQRVYEVEIESRLLRLARWSRMPAGEAA
jgi:hypothetical protein